MKNIFFVAAIAAFSLVACKKDTPTPLTPTTGNLKVELDPKWNGQVFALGNTYVTATGDSITPSMFKYYISNVVLTKEDGSTWTEENSYRLINHEDGAEEFTLTNVPAGEYESITFTLGVDSLHNVSGAQTGALDPANQMFWSWNSGYIFSKLEGTSPQSSTGNISFHVGGFKDPNNAIRTITLPFATSGGHSHAEVSPIATPEVHLFVNTEKTFNGINVSATNSAHMPGATAMKIADNYAGMFVVDHVH